MRACEFVEMILSTELPFDGKCVACDKFHSNEGRQRAECNQWKRCLKWSCRYRNRLVGGEPKEAKRDCRQAVMAGKR